MTLSRTWLTEEDQEKVLEVLRSDNPGADTDFEYLLAGEPTEGRHISTSYGREDKDRPGIVAATSLAGGIPADELKGETVDIILYVGGVAIPDFRGRIKYAQSGSESKIEAATPGFWLDKVDIGDGVSDNRSFSQDDPSAAYAFAISKVQGYQQARVEIEEVKSPPFSGDYTWDQSPWDILTALYEASDWFKTDTPSGGHFARPLRSPAEAKDVVWHYKGGVDFDDEEFLPEPTGNEYASVLALRDTGTSKVPIIEIPIVGSTAPLRSRYKIEYSTDNDPGDAEATYQAMTAATRFMDGESRVDVDMDWVNPLVHDGDYISLETDFDDQTKAGTRTYIAEVENSNRDLPSKKHRLSLRLVRSREDLIEPPVVVPFLDPDVFRPLIGLSLGGMFYLDDDLALGSYIGDGRYRVDLGLMDARGVTYQELTTKGLLRINF